MKLLKKKKIIINVYYESTCDAICRERRIKLIHKLIMKRDRSLGAFVFVSIIFLPQFFNSFFNYITITTAMCRLSVKSDIAYVACNVNPHYISLKNSRWNKNYYRLFTIYYFFYSRILQTRDDNRRSSQCSAGESIIFYHNNFNADTFYVYIYI